jgi:hypothetical protein
LSRMALNASARFEPIAPALRPEKPVFTRLCRPIN